MRRLLVLAALLTAAAVISSPAEALASPDASTAALQIALRAQGQYPAPVDGVDGPLTRSGLKRFQQRAGLEPTGTLNDATRLALGALGKPLLGQRELAVGAVGWDVSELEFKLLAFGLPLAAVDGRFTEATVKILVRYQSERGIAADGIAGPTTYRALASVRTVARAAVTHVVAPSESFFSIAKRYRISPLLLAKASGLDLAAVIVPGQRLTLPAGTRAPGAATGSAPAPTAGEAATADAVRASLEHWSAVYGVDPRLARATAWMESGFQQGAVSKVGAVGVMQLMPGTWAWVDQMLLRTTTPRTYDGNVRAGVRYLRWLLDEFGGDRRLALAGYYQGAQAVRDRGLFDDTKRYVATVLKLYGSV